MDTQNLLRNLYLSLLNVDNCLVQSWNFQKITSPFTRLYLVTSGEGNIIYNQKKIELKAGWMYMIPSYTQYNCSNKTFLGHFYIHFVPQLIGGGNLFKLLNFKYEFAATEKDFYLMNRILELNPEKKLVNTDPGKYQKENLVPSDQSNTPAQQVAGCFETQGILMQLFSRFIITDNQAMVKPGFVANSRISQAVEFIQMNLSKQYSLTELAGMFYLTNDYFSRLFLRTMGVRPIDYINRKRIEEAQLQLVSTNAPIEKIALDIGINNFSYFNRLFKKYSCNTPGGYRKLHKLV